MRKPEKTAMVMDQLSNLVRGSLARGQLPPGFQQFFGQGGRRMPQQPQVEHGIGSGIIISPDGYIVTNNHVIDNATEIRVTLNDRRVLKAKLVGADKLTDPRGDQGRRSQPAQHSVGRL